MTTDSKAIQAELIDTIYLKTRPPGSWKVRGQNSFETNIGSLNIHLDRSTSGSRVAYVVWIFGENGILYTIYDYSLQDLKPTAADFDNYGELLKSMYAAASAELEASRLIDVLAILKSGEVKSSSSDT